MKRFYRTKKGYILDRYNCNWHITENGKVYSGHSCLDTVIASSNCVSDLYGDNFGDFVRDGLVYTQYREGWFRLAWSENDKCGMGTTGSIIGFGKK